MNKWVSNSLVRIAIPALCNSSDTWRRTYGVNAGNLNIRSKTSMLVIDTYRASSVNFSTRTRDQDASDKESTIDQIFKNRVRSATIHTRDELAPFCIAQRVYMPTACRLVPKPNYFKIPSVSSVYSLCPYMNCLKIHFGIHFSG